MTEEAIVVHHKHSPSMLDKLERCPCYVKADTPDSDAARDGTLAHKAMETNNPNLILDEDLREHVLTCIAFRQQMREAYPEAVCYQEMTLSGSYNHGTADEVMIDYGRRLAILIDWKFGAVEVETTERNIQVLNYVLNLFSKVPEIDVVHAYIMQPRISREPVRAIRHKRDNGEIIQRIEGIIKRAEDPYAVPTPSPEACQYCGNKPTCPALNRIVESTTRSGLGFALPENFMIGIDRTPQEAAALYILAGVLDNDDTGWCKLMKKSVVERALRDPEYLAQLEECGLKMTGRQGNWSVKDQPGVLQELKSRGLADEELWECARLSVKKAVETLCERNSMLDAGCIMDEMALAGLCEQGEPVRYLRKVGKKRPDADRIIELTG